MNSRHGLVSGASMRLLMLCGISSLLGAGARAQVNLIDLAHGVGVGSFEVGVYSQTGLGFMRLPQGSTAIAGWVVAGVSGVDWLSEPVHAGAEGVRSLDLKGIVAGPYGEVSTSIPTCAGCTYVLQFRAYAGNVANTGTVTAGSLQAQSFSGPTTSSPSTAPYAAHSFGFGATAGSTTVTFRSSSSDGFGPVIDDVVVFATAGQITQLPHGCGGAILTVSGQPVLGGAVNAVVNGAAGVPLIGLGLNQTSVPLCSGCIVGHEWAVAAVGTQYQLAAPVSPDLIGLDIVMQAADLFAPGGCLPVQVTTTDTYVLTIG